LGTSPNKGGKKKKNLRRKEKKKGKVRTMEVQHDREKDRQFQSKGKRIPISGGSERSLPANQGWKRPTED